MALTKINMTAAHVRWDRHQARPSTVRVAGRRLTVRALDAVRDETAAYPADRGPRMTFLVETDAGQASLVFDRRRRRWFVDALDEAA
ncbi:MAG: hypothetical protein M3R32_05930 [Chloroflexota bacterium]|nr:hypothetical protein [Chloroflexota bacterium]